VKGLACKARIVAQSDALFHHRSGSHAGPQGTRKGSEVELPRTPDDGESERTGGEHAGDHGLRFGRASCRLPTERTPSHKSPQNRHPTAPIGSHRGWSRKSLAAPQLGQAEMLLIAADIKLRDCCQGESRIVSPHYREWNGPICYSGYTLASTIPPNVAPEAGLRARVAPATVNTRFNSGVLTCTFCSLPWGCSCGCPGRR